jgi:four helix bundle protein
MRFGEAKRTEMKINSAKELIVYRQAFSSAMAIFELSKTFPVEERYSLTSQIRRSSRSVCMNLREAWAKRRYEAHFISKLTDCDGENGETDTALDFAFECGYMSAEQHGRLHDLNSEVSRMLSSMIREPDKFLLKP